MFSNWACMFFNAVKRAVASELLGRIIIIMPRTKYDYHLANARLSDIPQLAGLSNINHRKGDDGSRVARQLKCIRDS